MFGNRYGPNIHIWLCGIVSAVTVSTLPWCFQLSHLAKDVTSVRRPVLERGQVIVGKQEWCNYSGVS